MDILPVLQQLAHGDASQALLQQGIPIIERLVQCTQGKLVLGQFQRALADPLEGGYRVHYII